MFQIAVWHGDLSDSYLRFVTQLGVDCIDFGTGSFFPGVAEQGYPDLDALLAIARRLRTWGLDINRVTLPDLSEEFMRGEGDERELESSCNAVRVFGEAGVPIVRQRFGGDTFPDLTYGYPSTHRGGYRSRGESWELARSPDAGGGPSHTAEIPDQLKKLEIWWERFHLVYERLVPVAHEYRTRLAIHPSDTPNPDTPLGGLGFHRVIDLFPQRNVGYLYCCGTRAEAGGSSLVLDEINNYGRKGRIFTVHLRNVRGSMATARGFEEVLLDDGDMNVFKILLELQKVGFTGCINPDHVPALEGDGAHVERGLAYSVGYLKAMFAALTG